jgi:urea carboxylase-associated protein 2
MIGPLTLRSAARKWNANSTKEGVLFDQNLPAGGSWSRVCSRHTALTVTDLEGGASIPMLLYRAEQHGERYCMPDTLKAQHVSCLTAGNALYSDMGRVMASIVSDTCGWHDTISGHLTDPALRERWGALSYQEARNEWRRSARDLLLLELAKHGLDRRDLVANINLFTKLAIDDGGGLSFEATNSIAGSQITLRFELDTLVILASAPHPLDPSPEFNARPVRLSLNRVVPPAADDLVRTWCTENARGMAESETLS